MFVIYIRNYIKIFGFGLLKSYLIIRYYFVIGKIIHGRKFINHYAYIILFSYTQDLSSSGVPCGRISLGNYCHQTWFLSPSSNVNVDAFRFCMVRVLVKLIRGTHQLNTFG